MTFARLVEGLMPHLIVVPILLPMVTAAVMLLLGDTRRPLKAIINVLSCVLGVGVAIALIYWVQRLGGPQAVGVYLPGNWPVPYGIVLVVDRLSAMMLLLTSVLGLGGVLYASARWHKAGVHFHPLFQLQLMGLYGAFLTADLFNLFVFFEIMLSASYGLLLHGCHLHLHGWQVGLMSHFSAAFNDTHLAFGFGNFEFGDVGVRHQINQGFEFSQIHG